MSENYVDDREFRSEIRRIEQKVDNAVERIELKMDVYIKRMDRKFKIFETNIDKRIERIESRFNFIQWAIGISAIIIVIEVFMIQIAMTK